MENHSAEGSDEPNFDAPGVNAFYEDSLLTNDSEAMTW